MFKITCFYIMKLWYKDFKGFDEHIYFYLLLHNNRNYICACKGANGMNMFKAKHNLIVQGTHIIPFIIAQ
jgi:hypothetical protein